MSNATVTNTTHNGEGHTDQQGERPLSLGLQHAHDEGDPAGLPPKRPTAHVHTVLCRRAGYGSGRPRASYSELWVGHVQVAQPDVVGSIFKECSGRETRCSLVGLSDWSNRRAMDLYSTRVR